MLLEIKSTVEQVNRIEIKVPSFYKGKRYATCYKLCEDCSIVAIGANYMFRYPVPVEGFKSSSYDREIGEMLAGEEITEKEFFEQFDTVLAEFQKSLIPSPEKISV